MKILITGAGGFIGKACVEAFAAAGWHVKAISRKCVSAQAAVEPIALEDPEDFNWSQVVEGVDCILHLAGVAHRPEATLDEYEAVNVRMTEALIKAAIERGVDHFIYMSSIAVHGRSQNVINESSPIEPEDSNGLTKAIGERQVRNLTMGTSVKWTIVRPPLVYGPGAPGNFRRLGDLIRRKVPLPLIAATSYRSYIGIENLVSALLRIACNTRAVNRTHLISDNDDLSTADLIRAMAQGLGRSPRLWWLPSWLLRAGGSLIGRGSDAERLLGQLQVDSRAICQELGWAPTTPAIDGIIKAMRGR